MRGGSGSRPRARRSRRRTRGLECYMTVTGDRMMARRIQPRAGGAGDRQPGRREEAEPPPPPGDPAIRSWKHRSGRGSVEERAKEDNSIERTYTNWGGFDSVSVSALDTDISCRSLEDPAEKTSREHHLQSRLGAREQKAGWKKR